MRCKRGWFLLVFLTVLELQVFAQSPRPAAGSGNANGILIVGGAAYPDSPNISVGITAAYADLPANGGTIVIPAASSCYKMTTPVIFNTPSKPVILDGEGGACIDYTAGGGTAFTFNNGDLTNHFRSGGMVNIVINGPAFGASTGIVLGGTNGAEGFYLTNSKLNWPAGTGILFGDNTWGTLFDHSTISGTPGINFRKGTANSGEDIEFHDTFVYGQLNGFTNCVVLDGGSGLQVSIVGGSFDDCQLTVQSGTLHVTDAHFENPGGRADSLSNPFISIAGNSTFNGIWLGQDAAAGVTTPQEILVTGNSQVAIFGGSFTSNATIPNLLTNAGSNVVYISPGNVGGFTNHSNTTGTGRVSEFPVYGLAGLRSCTQFSSGTRCNELPATTGTLSQFVVQDCGTTSGNTQSCARKPVNSPTVVFGEVSLNGSESQTISNLPFLNANYSCSGSDVTNPSGGVSFRMYTRETVIVLESGGGTRDHLRYQCVGY